MPKPEEKIRPALVAEYAFAKFCALVNGSTNMSEKEALEEAISRLRPLVDDPSSLNCPLNSTENEETAKILNRLNEYFVFRHETILYRPIFDGCGYVDRSEGDVLTCHTLFEIKTVDRPFRSIDIRQLVTYGALNYMSQKYKIKNFGIFNPRRGVYFEMPVDTIIFEISGQSSQDLFNDIIQVVSSGDISR